MKYVVFTDLHEGVHNNNDIWLEASLKLATEIKDVYETYCCDGFLFLGDFFNDRRSINTKTIDYSLKFMDIIKDYPSYFVIGNHDTYYKNSITPTSLNIFKEYKNFHLVDKLIELGDISLVPWDYDISTVSKNKILCGHFDIIGCNMNDATINDSDGSQISEFKNFDLVLSGHYHTKSENRNVTYIGSVMPFTFHDINAKRGYYILDTDDLSLKFFEFNQCPKYISINSDEKIDKNKIEGNCIKINYTNELSRTENENFIEAIQSYKPIIIETNFNNVEEEDEIVLDTDDIKKNEELFFDYLNKIKIPKHINTTILKKMFIGVKDEI